MPRGKKGAKTPRGSRQGKPLSDMEKEIVRQTQMITQNKAETARQMNITRKTVDNILKNDSAEDPAIKEARRQSAIALAGTVHGKIGQILDSIGPKDLETGFRDVFDANGNFVRRAQWGPSLLQKITSGAIFIDKLPVLAQYQQAISEDHVSGALPMPSKVSELLAGIRSKVKSITVLDVQFQDKNPDLSQSIQQRIAEAEVLTPAESEVLDFDNPGVSNDGQEKDGIGS